MSDQDNVFKTQEKVDDSAVTSPTSDTSVEDLLASITNKDGKPKYDSVPKALAALAHSQKHISDLEAETSVKDQEIKDSREMLSEFASLKETVDKLLTAEKPNVPEDKTAPVNNSLDAEAVAKILRDELAQRDAQSVAVQNMDKVAQALSAKYGDQAQAAINQKAKELGTTPEALGDLAKQNPTMVLAYFNSGVAPSTSTTPGSTIPLTPAPTPEIKVPEGGVMKGGNTTARQVALMREIRDKVYKDHGVET